MRFTGKGTKGIHARFPFKNGIVTRNKPFLIFLKDTIPQRKLCACLVHFLLGCCCKVSTSVQNHNCIFCVFCMACVDNFGIRWGFALMLRVKSNASMRMFARHLRLWCFLFQWIHLKRNKILKWECFAPHPPTKGRVPQFDVIGWIHVLHWVSWSTACKKSASHLILPPKGGSAAPLAPRRSARRIASD